MSAANQVMNITSSQLAEDVLEKVILNQDIAALKPIEKIEYVKNLALSLGLNPLTKPFEIIKFQGKEIVYARKDATEQLRKVNKVSMRAMETKMIMDNIYVVTAYARLPDGREDSSTGVVSIAGLKGDALANAMMKAETKAKRRVTLSICGLGFMDESETESLHGAVKIDPYAQQKIPEPVVVMSAIDDSQDAELNKLDLEADLAEITKAKTTDDLQETFTRIYKCWVGKKDKVALAQIIKAKDKRKGELMVSEFNQEIEDADVIEGEKVSHE